MQNSLFTENTFITIVFYYLCKMRLKNSENQNSSSSLNNIHFYSLILS
ncbi:hypothetical protein RCH33_1907 [Flavobacterium daejeonense]|nr:hypothetical protein RCH33_1907 [Flavobacterium daejeonense]